MNKGFTLIELLVVVLIIGILAAIALPQYTKAVERSRMAEAVQLLGDLATAESIYYMENNEFASVSDLNTKGDVTLVVPTYAEGDNWQFVVTPDATATDKAPVVITATRKGGMFNDSAIQLTVENTGAINKCRAAGSAAGFKTMAATAGYASDCSAS